MRALLDTDVVLDLMLARSPFDINAQLIFKYAELKTFGAYISAITPLNIFYIGRKILGGDAMRQRIADLLIIVQVCAIEATTISDALISPLKDYEDAVQHAAAIASNLDAVVTRNTKDFRHARLPVYDPAEFVKKLEAV